MTPSSLRDSTLVFLVKERNSEVESICLAMKKRGFGEGRWNGVGGKREKEESIEETAIRETKEEIGTIVTHIKKVAELTFLFPNNPEWNQLVHVFFSDKWLGEPKETEEMKPKWFKIEALPFQQMWPDDIFWLPEVLSGKFVIGKFKFGEGDVILEKEILLKK